MATEAEVREALTRVVDPAKGVDIVSAGQVTSLVVSGEDVLAQTVRRVLDEK